MGAWGSGTLDNDTALDLLDEFEHVGVSVIETVLVEASETPMDDVLDEEVGMFALAAAEVVATAHGHPPEGEHVPMKLLQNHAAEVRKRDGLVKLARTGAHRVTAENSGLLELWEEAGEELTAEFLASVQGLQSRLEAIR